jgi:hypothetical protein
VPRNCIPYADIHARAFISNGSVTITVSVHRPSAPLAGTAGNPLDSDSRSLVRRTVSLTAPPGWPITAYATGYLMIPSSRSWSTSAALYPYSMRTADVSAPAFGAGTPMRMGVADICTTGPLCRILP